MTTWILILFPLINAYGLDLLPKDPRASLQPLAPGFTWTYTVKLKGEPKSIRWFTEDFSSGVGFSILGMFTLMDEVKQGEFKIRYTITDERKTWIGKKGRGTFFKVVLDDPSTGRSLTRDETLYWGRWRYGSFSDLAICEVRLVGSVSKQFLETLGVYPPGTSKNKLHFRYLSMDILYDWPRKGEVAVGSMSIAMEGMWTVKSKGDVVTTQVPAGTFQAIATTFEYSFGGFVDRKITERLYYAPGKGLVKWTQTEDDEEVWTMELTSYSVGGK